MAENLLQRADDAAQQAVALRAEWFWLRLAIWHQRAERLADAEERLALAAHRAGLLTLFPPPPSGTH
jgi:hypothetical protein